MDVSKILKYVPRTHNIISYTHLYKQKEFKLETNNNKTNKNETRIKQNKILKKATDKFCANKCPNIAASCNIRSTQRWHSNARSPFKCIISYHIMNLELSSLEQTFAAFNPSTEWCWWKTCNTLTKWRIGMRQR